MADDFTPGVRIARAEDIPDVLRLAKLLRVHLELFRGGDVLGADPGRPVSSAGSLRAAFDSPTQLALVGCLGPVVVGYAVVTTDMTSRGPVAVVGELFVEPAARDVGVGEALMSRAVEWAESRGCVGIDSVTLPGDRETKNFFESFGLVARSITVHRRLDPVDPSPGPLTG